MKKYLVILSILPFYLPYSISQDIIFRAIAPDTVFINEKFRIQYELRNADGSNPEFPGNLNSLEILAGPSVSKSHAENGETIFNQKELYIFIANADKEGTFLLPEAKITANGNTYLSNPVTMNISKYDEGAFKRRYIRESVNPSDILAANEKINESTVFIRVIADKNQLSEKDSLTVTYRLYSIYNVKELKSAEYPVITGFNVKNITLTGRHLKTENCNGKNYFVADLKKKCNDAPFTGKENG